MDGSFWRGRWADGQTGWQESAPNELLRAHLDALESPARVLVPLCGKSPDLEHLAVHGSSVVGVELVEIAEQALFDERRIPARRRVDGALVRLSAGPIEIVVGDYFEVSVDHVGAFDGVYDRAALVAMPPGMATRYAAHTRSLLARKGRMLLVTFEHDLAGEESEKPPFSVTAGRARALYPDLTSTLLGEHDISARAESLRARGATRVRELALLWRAP